MPNISSLLDDHVVLKYDCVDRIFLNGYLPKLQSPDQLSWFLCQHRGQEIPRYALLGEMTASFIKGVQKMAEDGGIPVVHFERRQRKEAIARPHFAAAKRPGLEGVVIMGVSQERTNAFPPPGKLQRTKDKFAATRASSYVNHY